MLKNLLAGLILICFSATTQAQNAKNESIEINLGYSKHGSGDLPGFILNTEYRKYFKPKTFFTIGLGATWHDGQDKMLFTDPGGTITDISIREVTAGLQLTSRIGWDLISTSDQSLGLSIGPLLRYQTSSAASNGYSISSPAVTGLPYPSVTFFQKDPQRTFNVGAILQFSYRQLLSDKLFAGVNAGLQVDSYSDLIVHAAASFGFRF